MNYGEIKANDIANGPGVRVSLFVSGCTHQCKGCFNPETWDFNYGKKFTEDTLQSILEYMDYDHIEGLTFLGGEPFEPQNSGVLKQIAKISRSRFPEKTIWCYSGYTLDDILKDRMNGLEDTFELLNSIDVLVDGEFVEDLKSLILRFRGSSNQRLIDIPKTLNSGEIVLWDDSYDRT